MIEVLKVTGIILLCILALIVVLVLCVLLIPVRYNGEASYKERFIAKAQAGWLFNLVGVSAEYNERVKCCLILFGRARKVLYESPDNVYGTDKQSGRTEDRTEPSGDSESEAAPPAENPENRSEELLQSDRELKKENKSGETEKITDKLIRVKELLDSKEFQSVRQLIIHRGKKLLKHAFPRKITGRLEYGFEDPAKTGYVLAGLATLYPFFGDGFEVIPHFDTGMMDFEFSFKGRLIAGYCLIQIAAVWFNKDFRRLLCQIKSTN